MAEGQSAAPAGCRVDLSGQVALVTGASRGIGRAIAVGLAACGASVAGVARTLDALQGTLQAIREAGGSAEGYAADVSKTEDVQRVVEEVEAKFQRIHILVNNAGITRDQLFMRMKDEDWDEVLAVDLTAAFRLARAAVRGMMRRRFGRIIGIASVVGVTGNAGQANYAAAKAGMIAMTKSLAWEVASRGVTANVVAPGFIETAMTDALTEKQKESILVRVPAGRLGAPEDVAAAALYLASNEGAYVTGQTLHVNGGMAMI
jgi:3-oxoacyl-[acyl-carrier protein] reductase